ncbi:15498_t:CDS:2, partial [Gigaspora margarita]
MSLKRNKYSEKNPFSFRQNNTKYTYNIINEGYYPPKNMLCYISNHNTSSGKTQYKILDGYLVETSWRRKSRHTIECEIEYNSEGPVFIIRFNENSQQHIIQSKESLSNIATEYLRRKGSNSHARISGIHVFGLNAIDVEQEYERKRKENRACFLKPFSVLCKSMKTKCSRSFSLHISKNYLVDYCKEKEDQNINAFVYVIDQNLISQNTYRDLSALEPDLPQEYNISNIKKKINEKMNKKIPIFILDLKNISITTTNKISHIDEVKKEMVKYIGKAGYKKITDILLFVIPGLVDRNILNVNNPVIHIRISGDGRNVSRKIKHVMVMFTILDNILNIHKAEFHYTIILYPGNENYEILQKVMEPMINELHSLQMRITFALGVCAQKRKLVSRASTSSLYDSLETLEHYVPDLLHVMLRIWDHMWSLIIQELKSENRYNNNIRTII